jgi:hypothetical protein
MKIIIPTYRRTGSQHTYKQLPENWKRETTFVVDQLDHDTMTRGSSFKDANFVIVPPVVTSIAKKRTWILENIECQKMVMLDDDLAFAIRRYRENGKISQCKPTTEETDYWLSELSKMLDQYVHAGFSARQFNNAKPKGWLRNSRMMYSLGYQPKTILKDCLLGRIETREDMDITLQLFKKGHPNMVCSEFCHDQVYNTEGGCSLTRTLDSSNADAEKLSELHPGLVRVVEKDYKRSMRRKEVICAWKKAFVQW